MTNFWVVIPARRASTRLPDKALADIGGIWPLERITGALSECAETALDLAERAVRRLFERHPELPGLVR